MFYLTDSFIILSSLLLFILPVALGNGAVLVRAGKGIEYPDVEVCPLPVSSPKVLCDDVKVGPVFTVRRSVEVVRLSLAAGVAHFPLHGKLLLAGAL